MAKMVGLSRNLKPQWLNKVVEYYSFTELGTSVYMFPYDYKLEKETIMMDERFVINNFGGELSIALKA